MGNHNIIVLRYILYNEGSTMIMKSCTTSKKSDKSYVNI